MLADRDINLYAAEIASHAEMVFQLENFPGTVCSQRRDLVFKDRGHPNW